jgi:hypothetical protein
MIKTALVQDLWSAMKTLIMIARRHDVAAIINESNCFRVIYSTRITLEDMHELATHDPVLLLVNGKATKSKLNDEQRKYFLELAREANSQLN